MANDKTCPKCESRRWMTGLQFDPLSDLHLSVTKATWVREPKGATSFTASICGDCGYSEIFATKPLAVWDEWRLKNA